MECVSHRFFFFAGISVQFSCFYSADIPAQFFSADIPRNFSLPTFLPILFFRYSEIPAVIPSFSTVTEVFLNAPKLSCATPSTIMIY